MEQIIIRPIENREREYFAFFKDDFLKATFSVAFQDTIVGAVALNRFSEMLKTMYKGRQIDFKLSDRKVMFKSQAVLDSLGISGKGGGVHDHRRSN